MAERTHPCPGKCGAEVQHHQLACKPCWFRLPKPLRDDVNDAYRNKRRTHWYSQRGRSNVVRKCRRCKKESNAARPRRPMTDQDKERLAARDRRGRQRARPARLIPDPWLTREGS